WPAEKDSRDAMRRRDFVVRAGAAAITLAAPSLFAQKKTRVIGLLWNDSVKPSPYATRFLAALHARGYSVGENLRVEDRVSVEGYASLGDGARALVKAKVDVIVAYGATAVGAAAKATTDIPIVMLSGVDPVGAGWAVALSRPGKNLTGVSTLMVDLSVKRMQLLKEVAPKLSRVGVFRSSTSGGNDTAERETKAAALKLKLKPVFGDAPSPRDIERGLSALLGSRIQAIFVMGGSMLAANS